ncbi:MAG: site-specific integrase [Firmicutes bacterium]|nr:site-specific integrase [Bacillota bacterium]
MAKKTVLKFNRNAPQTWEDALQEFLWYKQAEGISETTANDYRTHISMFYKSFPAAYEEEQLKRSVLEYMAKPAKPAYYNLKLIYLRAFFNWSVKEGIYCSNPLTGFKKRKADGRVVNLTEESLRKLLSLPDKSTFAGLRDYTIFLISLDTGIRPKELFSLIPSDFNLRSLEVNVRSEISKTRSSRSLPLSPATAKAVRDLIAARHKSWDENTPVFCTIDGIMLSRSTWGKRMVEYSKKLGVKICPYFLRHAFALQFLRNGGHALALQRTLGHSDLSMTKRYIALTESDIRLQHHKASPLNKLIPKRNRVRKVT